MQLIGDVLNQAHERPNILRAASLFFVVERCRYTCTDILQNVAFFHSPTLPHTQRERPPLTGRYLMLRQRTRYLSQR